MRRTIRLLGWGTVFITVIAIILTMLTTYQFVYIKYFNSYYVLQWCLFFTMIIWAINFIDLKNIKKVYPIVCGALAAGSIFFIIMKVY
ncbi:hypothetical protein GCM10008905_03910 [Clostridium malenominatum]|uniref:Uncharacterized protein n=1 Tax=Clostridium malenominatum TaxID=1539 RepID=A0ABP3TUF3_9CLOT